ncbi:MAG TPA: sugar ABC transporter ATP-binding protein [Noviherbaspirillum sp.]
MRHPASAAALAPAASAGHVSPVLSVSGICKSFPGVRALSNARLNLYPGEVHVLMGQNGAGKSTLIKVLTGVEKPDAGEILLGGERIAPSSVLDAQNLGISTVYQEVNLCPNLSVAENICIGRFPRHWKMIHWRAAERRAKEILLSLGIDIDVSESVSAYPVAIQQMVAIARAVSAQAKVLILDEPTSSLDEHEVAQLFQTMRALKEQGIAILFVTHFLEQTYAVGDRITVMRNGEFEGEYAAAELPRLTLINKMVGREFDESAGRDEAGRAANVGDVCLTARSLGRRGSIEEIDLTLQRGRVVGLAGLLGSGRTETARLLYGVDAIESGDLAIDGTNATLRSPSDAIRRGIALCSEDRKTEGVVAELSIRENIILALQAKLGVFRYLSQKQQRAIADGYIEQLGIRTPDAEKPIGLLSGGNQQKALLARWLAIDPKVLILDEPTRGIDIAAKLEIMNLVTDQCRHGLAILFISSELSEVLRVSDEIVVLRDRRKVGVLSREEADEDGIYEMIAGDQP